MGLLDATEKHPVVAGVYRMADLEHFAVVKTWDTNYFAKNIGGPSAGLIFSLAMIEKLGAEDLVRGRNIAGTGTIEPNGEVGPIGGIEEKLIGAAREGAKLFIAPSLNCPDIRHTPRGLQVVPVDTLTGAISVLREKDPERLPMCG